MKTALTISSLLFLFSSSIGQNFSYKSVIVDSSYKIWDIDIDKDGIKDKIACDMEGDDLLFYVKKNNSYVNVFHGDNFNSDGLFFVFKIKSYVEDDNVLYIKSFFGGAGGLSIERFFTYKNGKWQLSKSITNSSTFSEIKICFIDYLSQAKQEVCFSKKDRVYKENDLIFETIKNIKSKDFLSTKEYLYCLLNEVPLSKKNCILYDNLAFELGKSSKNEEAIYLSKKILMFSPHRAVAYLNIADYYWAMGNKEFARKNYKKYLVLIKSQKKNAKNIPSYLLERISNY